MRELPGRRRPSAPEDQSEATVSTAHKAKGREWAQVKIADDFTPPSGGPPHDTGQGTARRIDDKEACLAYVAVTRTRRRLDIGGLSWINEHPEGASAATTARATARTADPDTAARGRNESAKAENAPALPTLPTTAMRNTAVSSPRTP
jgi:superfamily I DNA/RNA helicase